ncbi:MAG: glycosyltransferase family 2 protein [Mucilaginibacter sp.]
MDQPLVSIIIPAYNSGKYLGETIRSVMRQTWPNTEIIIVDDGSADNSLEIAKKHQNDRVKVIGQANKGASGARNRGIKEAKGDYIQFLDADDLLAPDKIEKQLKAIVNDPNTMAYGALVRFSKESEIASKEAGGFLTRDYASGKDLLYDLFGGNSATHTGGMIALHAWLTPAQIIRDAGGWNETVTVDDDGEFFCRVVLKAEKIKYVKDAVCYYRKHEHNENLSAQKSLKAYQSAFDAIRLKQQHTGNDPAFNVLLANQAMLILNSLYPTHPQLCREMQDFIDQMGGNNWQPYQEGSHKILRQLFGWKTVKLLSHYKNKLVPNK